MSCFLNGLGGSKVRLFLLLLEAMLETGQCVKCVNESYQPQLSCTLSTSSILQQSHGEELLEIPTAGSISKAKELLDH